MSIREDFIKSSLINVHYTWKEDECGGGVAKMEERCKLEAYDYFIDGKQVECFCKRYKKKGD